MKLVLVFIKTHIFVWVCPQVIFIVIEAVINDLRQVLAHFYAGALVSGTIVAFVLWNSRRQRSLRHVNSLRHDEQFVDFVVT